MSDELDPVEYSDEELVAEYKRLQEDDGPIHDRFRRVAAEMAGRFEEWVEQR